MCGLHCCCCWSFHIAYRSLLYLSPIFSVSLPLSIICASLHWLLCQMSFLPIQDPSSSPSLLKQITWLKYPDVRWLRLLGSSARAYRTKEGGKWSHVLSWFFPCSVLLGSPWGSGPGLLSTLLCSSVLGLCCSQFIDCSLSIKPPQFMGSCVKEGTVFRSLGFCTLLFSWNPWID